MRRVPVCMLSLRGQWFHGATVVRAQRMAPAMSATYTYLPPLISAARSSMSSELRCAAALLFAILRKPVGSAKVLIRDSLDRVIDEVVHSWRRGGLWARRWLLTSAHAIGVLMVSATSSKYISVYISRCLFLVSSAENCGRTLCAARLWGCGEWRHAYLLARARECYGCLLVGVRREALAVDEGVHDRAPGGTSIDIIRGHLCTTPCHMPLLFLVRPC